MKLSNITENHLIAAAKKIDTEGIPKQKINNKYWLELNDKEYPFKHLTNEAYKIAENTNEDLDFQSTENYRNDIESFGYNINRYPQNINFFKKYEVEYFLKVAIKSYRKSNPEDVLNSKLIIPNVKKLNFWAAESVIEDFEPKLDNSWQWSGTFKSYLWIRVLKKNKSKKVFFVLGITENGLDIHLDCQRSNHTGGKTEALPIHIIESFDRYLNEADYSPKSIKLENFDNYNWDSLIEFTQNYFYKYESLYDELEALTREGKPVKQKEKYKLFDSDIPDKTKSYVNRNRSFKGRNTDWSKKQATSSKLGLLGEELVIHIEKQKLEELGFLDKTEDIQKKLDGEGYDIYSYDENGDEIFIEVKTTKGNIDEPFYLSINEKEFWQRHSEKYVIYRLYNYDYLNKTANIYKIKGSELSEFILSPTNFEVSKT
jgi:hypothetical protein